MNLGSIIVISIFVLVGILELYMFIVDLKEKKKEVVSRECIDNTRSKEVK